MTPLKPNQTVGQETMPPHENKFHKGNPDGKHYWLTPPALFQKLKERFGFNFDPCPFPRPDDFDGLTCEWGDSNYVNPPFGSIIHEGKKKGATAWVRKAIAEYQKGKRVVLVHPIDKWVLMMLASGAKVENLGDVKWLATEDGSEGNGTGRHIAMFILDPANNIPDAALSAVQAERDELREILEYIKEKSEEIATQTISGLYPKDNMDRMHYVRDLANEIIKKIEEEMP